MGDESARLSSKRAAAVFLRSLFLVADMAAGGVESFNAVNQQRLEASTMRGKVNARACEIGKLPLIKLC